MWGGLEKILENVTIYSTNAGKGWYLIVFVFRLLIVATVGQSVYSDEQSAFRCSTKVIGCDNVCYDKFSKISHIRYWTFQLLAVTTPAVLFHFYSLNVQARVAKIKAVDPATDDYHDGNGTAYDSNPNTDDEINRARVERHRKKLQRRKQSVGAFKAREVYRNNNFETVIWTRSIRVAYLVNVVLRIVVELVSLYVAYTLFHFADFTATESYNPLGMIIIKVPQVFLCEGENVEWACGQHLNLGRRPGYVPCWVSRPWEKTIFMCYMNILSAFCCILSGIEFVQLVYRYSRNTHIKYYDRRNAKKKSMSFRLGESVWLVNETRGRRIPRDAYIVDDKRSRHPVGSSGRVPRSRSRIRDRQPHGGNTVPDKVRRDNERSEDGRGRSVSKAISKRENKGPVSVNFLGSDGDVFAQPPHHTENGGSG